MNVRRLTAVAVALLCGCVLAVAGCGVADTAATTISTRAATSADAAAVTAAITETAGTGAPAETAQLYPVRVDGKWGFIDNTGAIKIEPRFAGIRRLDGEGGLVGFREGLCAVQLVEDGPWGFVDTSGRVVIEPQFDLANWFSAGLARVRTGDDWYVIDRTGAVVAKVDMNTDRPAEGEGQGGSHLSFSEGLAAMGVGENDDVMKYGYVDQTGAWVIQPQFWEANPFSEGLARVAVKGKDGVKIGFIDKTGAWAVEPRFNDAHDFVEGLAIAWWDTECGYIDKTGKVVIPIPFQIAGFDFSGGIAQVGEGRRGSPSYIDKTGRVIWQGE